MSKLLQKQIELGLSLPVLSPSPYEVYPFFLWSCTKSCCSGCHRMFTSLSAFDLHRTGKFQREMRRCLTE